MLLCAPWLAFWTACLVPARIGTSLPGDPVKATDCSEEVEEDGTIVRREHERFTNELILLFASGKTAILR